MILHAFYNDEFIGDVLLVRLSSERHVTEYKKEDDLCVLYHNDDVVGYNVFHASQYFDNLTVGMVKITPAFVDAMNALLDKHQMDHVESDYDDHFKVGHVDAIEVHPDSDHMHICSVNTGNDVKQIVCGAKNIALDQLVVVAEIGAVMPNGLVIEPSKLRGVDSFGMICSARELALPNAPQVPGILVLDKDQYHVGESFFR